jgi:hypothetical protein
VLNQLLFILKLAVLLDVLPGLIVIKLFSSIIYKCSCKLKCLAMESISSLVYAYFNITNMFI